ncbi:acyloxyacyl hydrolase [Azomonas macrocytogenes]|uniref:Lipid A deacylase n=1 Tax=Azomonas macrocytogenes TaxID=69962 RepID=A0A839SZD7_AZOMA|nr:acyloxyacyl hydrolase [Azomonas macrocytogenes]MBB3102697.1 lipid A 3-O-deacylase [Azomonas macrocytogenes]
MKKRLLPLAGFAALSFGQVELANALDVTAAAGISGQGNATFRIGTQWNWDKKWLQSNTGHVTGYWDAAYTWWDGGSTEDNHSLSFSPVFVYEFDGFSSVKPFIEAGIGVAFFTQTEIDHQRFGTSFNFEDRIGAGLRFKNGHEVGVRAIHYSNAGIKEPNDGVESYSMFYRAHF